MTRPYHKLAPHRSILSTYSWAPSPGVSRAPGIAGQKRVSVGDDQAKAGRQRPIGRISFTTHKDERAAQVSELKDLYAAGSFDEIRSRAEACPPKDAEGEKSDVVHDLLAFLAEQMIDLNKQKQSEIESFLRWLVEETGAKVDALTNKTKVRTYYELDVSELLAILKKNKRKLSADPAKRKFQDGLRQEFTDSMATLGPLLAQIEETDRLIDEIVYKLYGLNDEEIGIVEQAAG